MPNTKKHTLSVRNFIALLFAGIINATGVTLLLAPLSLFDSGISGLSLFLDSLTKVPMWIFLIALNFPIFLLAFKKQGLAFTVYSLFAITIYSLTSMVYQDLLPSLLNVNYFVDELGNAVSPIGGSELILCSVFGGLLSGMGSGFTIRFGGAMDGIETLAVIFSKKLGLTIGNFVLIFNIILYLTIGVVFSSFTIPLYSIISYFVGGKAVDFITEGLDQGKGAFIITTKYDEIAAALSDEFGRGLTIIEAKGYYSGAHKQVIYCVVNRFQITKLRTIVAELDHNAFVTIMEISDVFGTSVKLSRIRVKKRSKKNEE